MNDELNSHQPQIQLTSSVAIQSGLNLPQLSLDFRQTTDDKGRFVFERVIAGPNRIADRLQRNDDADAALMASAVSMGWTSSPARPRTSISVASVGRSSGSCRPRIPRRKLHGATPPFGSSPKIYFELRTPTSPQRSTATGVSVLTMYPRQLQRACGDEPAREHVRASPRQCAADQREVAAATG